MIKPISISNNLFRFGLSFLFISNPQLKNYLEMYEQERMSVIEYSFIYMNHFCLIFELMGASLIKEIQENKFSGFPLVYVQSVLKNILPMLSSLSNLGLMHCDVKPENILKFGESFKLIDFGSCLFVANNSIFYVQSRFYRAPEVALKIPFDSKVDVWSLGCVAVELFLGLPLFPARSEVHLSSLIEQTIGKYPEHMYRQSPRRDKLFSNDGTIKSPTELCRDNDEDFATEFQPYFTKTKLLDILDSYETEGDENNGHNRELFIDLVNKMLKIDPEERISADSALNHPFFDIRFTS
ncbi:CMGC family protein kinase [Tritrichomonas foetus]|uniref:CMGC family protein kinase n=1 Tax=Tritrichomonas foetus TaxID=1144522 RepID=A0A1J4KYD7_9EUKA|nr:CMGC family protein kinase [Tritrichomonas foetus]|eukprot:OHT16178.1 CMGC family protein kinase [Tritrichomonas foetus]